MKQVKEEIKEKEKQFEACSDLSVFHTYIIYSRLLLKVAFLLDFRK